MANPTQTPEAESLDPTALLDLEDHLGIMEGLDEAVYTPDDDLPADLPLGEGLIVVERALDEWAAGFGPAGINARAAATQHRALWLPQTIQAAGLRVALEPGWEGRGRPFTAPLEGVMEHHTASRAGSGNASSLRIVRDGRPDLGGPLAQIVLARDGLVIVVASGRANHAGAGYWEGFTDGNGRFLGIEAENSGTGEPWTPAQYDAYVRLVAALLRRIGRGAHRAVGHKEYARPAGRKPDPTFSMAEFRANVDGILRGVVRPPDPHVPPEPPSSAERLAVDGRFGPGTIAALQRALNRLGSLMKADGVCGPGTTRGLQAYLNHRSHFAGRGDIAIDGKMGPQTVKALQWWLGIPQDGKMGQATIKSLQARLNAGTF